ncbi:uncharacterized protein TNCV_3356541 [Trichonephila clavipes]|nr:uncharacterized protein TNCV_3356541 [Trichonephila clavipes]
MGSIIEIKEKRQDFMTLNFPVKDIHLIVQSPVLFNACTKLGVVIDVFPYLGPHLQRIPVEDVLGYALANPESSVRDISKACSYSKLTVWNILHTYGAYSYRPVLTQELITGDQDRRFDFSNFVLNTLDANPDFLNEVLWSDECQFSRQEDEVSLRDLSRMWYQHDGAPAHKSAQPCTFVAQTFDTRIIGYGGQEVAEDTGEFLTRVKIALINLIAGGDPNAAWVDKPVT